jgi:hypothetical protein
LRIKVGKILGPKKEQVTGDWRRLHIEELHDLYCSPNTLQLMKFKKDELAGLSTHGGENECIQCFGGEIGRKVTIWKEWP